MSDGGRTALAGYLWQLMGVLGLAARASVEDDPDAAGELNALVDILVPTGEVRTEDFDQDASLALKHSLGLVNDEHRVLVQFKYSRVLPTPSISDSDLGEIKRQLQASAQSAAQHGVAIDAYVLLTNRHIASRESESTLQQAPGPVVFTESVQGVPLRLVTRMTTKVWEQELERLGATYGCFEEEIRRGVRLLIGELVAAASTGDTHPLTRDDVISALTGFPNAYPLTFGAVNERTTYGFAHIRSTLGVGGDTIRRDEVFAQLDRGILSQPIVMLLGHGGIGKTVTLYAWLQEQRARAQRIGIMTDTSRIDDNFITREALTWATDAALPEVRSQDHLDRILERVLRANPKAEQLLFVLALDDLEEGDARGQANAIQRLFQAFIDAAERQRRRGQAPRASLIVTCREPGQLPNVLPVHDYSGFGSGPDVDSQDWCVPIRMTEFSLPDLGRAVEQLAQPVRTLAEESILRARATVDGSMLYAGNTGIATTEDLPLAVGGVRTPRDLARFTATQPSSQSATSPIDLLRNPVLWRAFLGLDPSEQHAYLSGDLAALPRLARVYVGRFCMKASTHLPGRLTNDELTDALRRVANWCMTREERVFSRTAFIEQAQASQVLTRFESGIFFRESLTAGLLTPEGKSRWRWAYDFVCAYLAREEEDDLLLPDS